MSDSVHNLTLTSEVYMAKIFSAVNSVVENSRCSDADTYFSSSFTYCKFFFNKVIKDEV